MARGTAAAGPHERYRARLEAVSDTVGLVGVLASLGLIEEGVEWRRHFGRFHPGEPAWATVVLESEGRLPVSLEFLEERPDPAGAQCVPFAAGGWARATTFPEDTRLEGLAQVVGGLRACRVVRYRPGRRCTMRGVADGRDQFVKVSSAAADIHAIGGELWGAATDGRLGFDVAEPLGLDPGGMAVRQGIVAGAPVIGDVLGPDGPTWSRRFGEALGRLACAGLRPRAEVGPAEQLARTARGARGAALRVPALAPRIEAVIRELTRRHEELAPRPLVPVHGSPHVHQWLEAEGRLGLVDFDRYAWGEPELDVATYLAELDTERALTVPVPVHEQAIVDGFAGDGVVLDPERLWLYRVHKRLSKVVRTTHALRVDGDVRAARHLAAVEEILAVDGGPSAIAGMPARTSG